jgi:hypothetical protein
MSILKRQRELKRAEKAARKRAKRHGTVEEGLAEPRPTIGTAELLGLTPTEGDDEAPDSEPKESE